MSLTAGIRDRLALVDACLESALTMLREGWFAIPHFSRLSNEIRPQAQRRFGLWDVPSD